MYANTLPLLKGNFNVIDELILLDANNESGPALVAYYEKEAEQLTVYNDSANWFNNDLRPFIESRI